MLQELIFVDSVLLITVFDLAAVCGKFSCKNTLKLTRGPGSIAPAHLHHCSDHSNERRELYKNTPIYGRMRLKIALCYMYEGYIYIIQGSLF